MSSVLAIDGLVAGYGSARVLNGVDAEVEEGEVAVILGANGVGKTTTLRAVSGFLRPWAGQVRLDGRPLGRVTPERVVRLGVGVVPEPPGVFRDMSVLDVLRVGAFSLPDRRAGDERLSWVLRAFPLLAERRAQRAGSLSGGEQRQLAVARAMMGRPRLLLVDEVSMGLSPTMVTTIFDLLDRLRREEGITVLMVEQNVSALDVADRAYVMEKGRIVQEARGAELRRARAGAARAYLGAGAASSPEETTGPEAATVTTTKRAPRRAPAGAAASKARR
ncbi:MAG: ABC transporter ATP-binding protein [Acidobacteria bacterium]|nr:ABC transporter ATP-binding protein [Acidobacteriota bacterium]